MKLVAGSPLASPRKFKLVIGLPLLLGLLLAACATGRSLNTPAATSGAFEAGYVKLQPEALNSMLQSDEFILVNVHIPYEGQIPGTDVQIPYDQIGIRLPEIVPDRQTKVVLYCRSGSMSTIAAQALTAAGYENVYELEGGFLAWQAAGFEFTE